MPENYISKFSPNSWFFTEPEKLSQTAGQSFGPSSANEFVLTNRFNIDAAGAKAFAICKGVVLIQPQTGDPTKVNLVLRPFSQPVQGFNIRYFVYRGLNLDDFFTGNKIKPDSNVASDFIKKINKDFTDYHSRFNEPVPEFLSTYIGYGITLPNDTPLPESTPVDYFFFKDSDYVTTNGESVETSDTSFELPVTEGGKWLGNFAGGECGLDIVINYGDYDLAPPHDEFVFDLSYVRTSVANIDITGSTGLVKKQKQAQIYQFLDVAAFYGFHLAAEGKVWVNNSGTKETKTGGQIYSSILERFSTSKNRLYLYIQSDRSRPYNFYGNYTLAGSSNSLKIGADEAGLTAAPFETQGWPLLILTAGQSHSENFNKTWLQLATDNREETALYGQIAQINNALKGNFINADGLLQGYDENGEPIPLTNSIILSNPAVDVAGEKKFVAGFNLLLYQGKTYWFKTGTELNEQQQTIDVYAAPNFFDDVFGELTAKPLFKAGTNAVYSQLSSHKLSLINHTDGRQQLGLSAVQTVTVNDVIETGIASPVTVSRVTYFSESVDIYSNSVSVVGTITPETKTTSSGSGSVTGLNTFKLPSPFYYTLQLFTDSTETITGLVLNALDGSTPNKILLGLTKAENDALKALVTANSLSNGRLFLVDLFEDEGGKISFENIPFQQYKAGVVGEKLDGKLELFLPSTDIMVYSLDRKWHFSKGYSEYVKEDESIYVEIDPNY